ncbi:MAG: hypothetical protein AB1758_13785, partial [Candidatus Eremiobacterota bacterium]
QRSSSVSRSRLRCSRIGGASSCTRGYHPTPPHSKHAYGKLTNNEFLDALAGQLALNGRGSLDEVETSKVTGLKKAHRSSKKALEGFGLSSGDINHAFSAAAAGCSMLTTDDADFWDPHQKSGSDSNRVKEHLAAEFQVNVLSSPETCAHFGVQAALLSD